MQMLRVKRVTDHNEHRMLRPNAYPVHGKLPSVGGKRIPFIFDPTFEHGFVCRSGPIRAISTFYPVDPTNGPRHSFSIGVSASTKAADQGSALREFKCPPSRVLRPSIVG